MNLKFNGLTLTVKGSSLATYDQVIDYASGWVNDVSNADLDMGWFVEILDSRENDVRIEKGTHQVARLFSDRLATDLGLQKKYFVISDNDYPNPLVEEIEILKADILALKSGISVEPTPTPTPITTADTLPFLGDLSDVQVSGNVEVRDGWIRVNDNTINMGNASFTKQIPAGDEGEIAILGIEYQNYSYASTRASIDIKFELGESVFLISSDSSGDYQWDQDETAMGVIEIIYTQTGEPMTLTMTDNTIGPDPDRLGHHWRVR